MASFFAFFGLVFVAAFFGSRFIPGAWYTSLIKPSWTPPNWLFGPVWTLLYIGIAVSGWLVWRRSDGRWHPALVLWALQLILNALWSWLFFGQHRSGAALLDIVILFAAIVGFIVTANPVSHLAASLFAPYALWVGFAAALNFALWQLNRGTGTQLP